jgi:Cysteine-rich secretory protein family
MPTVAISLVQAPPTPSGCDAPKGVSQMGSTSRAAFAATLMLVASALAACSSADNGSQGTGERPAGTYSGNGNTGGPSGADAASPGTGTPPPTKGDASTSPPPATDAGTAPPPVDAAPPPPPDGFDQFQHHNLDVVNAYRAKLGVAPLTLDKQLCTFALAGSTELSSDHAPHQHFINAGNDGSLWNSGFKSGAAENQGDPNGWYVMSQDPTQNELLQIDDIQKAMFDEGPGAGEAHGHYTNMVNATYQRLGVGLVEVQGQLYLTNDFSD